MKDKLIEKYLIAEQDDMKTITIVCRDGEGSLEAMLNHIKNIGNIGHSFEIVVDPDGGKDYRKSFGWDGDGRDMIKSIKAS